MVWLGDDIELMINSVYCMSTDLVGGHPCSYSAKADRRIPLGIRHGHSLPQEADKH